MQSLSSGEFNYQLRGGVALRAAEREGDASKCRYMYVVCEVLGPQVGPEVDFSKLYTLHRGGYSSNLILQFEICNLMIQETVNVAPGNPYKSCQKAT